MRQIRNNKPVEKTDIEYLVLKNFIAVLKKNGMYPMFRCSVGWNTKNVVSNMYRHMNSFGNIMRNQSKENIYKDAGDMNVFLQMMKSSFSEDVPRGGDPAKMQHHIANCVNMLLHVFIERNIRDFHKLESLGAEVFDLTCREVFGNDFTDMLTPPANIEQMRQINEMMMRGEKPTPEMMERLQREMMEMQRRQQENDPGFQPLPMVEDLDGLLDEFLEDGEEGEDEPGYWDDLDDADFDGDYEEADEEVYDDWNN